MLMHDRINIGVAVAADWNTRTFLWLAIYLNIIYWVIPQGFGGIATGSATDPNAGLLFIVLAVTLYTLLPSEAPAAAPAVEPRQVALIEGH